MFIEWCFSKFAVSGIGLLPSGPNVSFPVTVSLELDLTKFQVPTNFDVINGLISFVTRCIISPLTFTNVIRSGLIAVNFIQSPGPL